MSDEQKIDDLTYNRMPMGKPFHFYLSPTPEYRSVMVDVKTHNGVAICWDSSTELIHVERCAECLVKD